MTLFSGRPLFAGVSPAFNHLTPPIEITPSLNNTWEDVDTTLLFTAGASGVIVQFENTGVSNTDWGVRPKGSVRAFFTDGAKTNQQGWIMTGTNASGVFQVYSGNTATVRTYIVGYTMSGVKFFTEPIDKTVVADNTWRDVDISAETGGDTAIGAIFTVLTTAGASCSYALRKKGSSDDRFSDLRAETPTLGLIGVDANELAQLRIESLGGLELRLEGYVTDGAVFFDNATPKSTGTTGSYQSVDITGDLLGSDNANGAIAEIHPWGRATPTATRTLPPASPTITSWKTSRLPGRRSFTARSRRRPWQGFRLLVLIPARAIALRAKTTTPRSSPMETRRRALYAW